MQSGSIIYLDHAATSWPKPNGVIEAMTNALLHDAANPGRGSHAMAVRASRILFNTRKQLAKLFNIKNPNDIAFTSSTTMGLNLAIKGLLRSGDHVIATSVEHNSVRRPLYALQQDLGIEVTYLESNREGEIDLDSLKQSIRSNTKLIIANHSSNLLGTIMPIAEIGEIAAKHNIYFLVDAAQSAGVIPIDVEAMHITLLAFPGHKGLLGPQGTGGLYISPQIELDPLLHGGTGSQSEAPYQPTVRPDRYEAGTQNTAGIAGLNAAILTVMEKGVEQIYKHEWDLTQQMMSSLIEIPHVHLLGPSIGKPRTGIVSFNIDGIDPSELAFILDRHYSIAVRSGFHCTPDAHRIAGTDQQGAVRASVGFYTTSQEIKMFIEAIQTIVSQYHA